MRVLIYPLLLVSTINSFHYTNNVDTRCDSDSCPKDFDCMRCTYPKCKMGEEVDVHCVSTGKCGNPLSMKTRTRCLYCWQLEDYQYDCDSVLNCSSTSTEWIAVRCKVHSDVACKGSRTFFKNSRCNWSSGFSWTRTLFFSVTLGGFGVDRFYLGLWKSAIGKLFSFGGLGVWTVVDVVLVALGYIRPADGSLYS